MKLSNVISIAFLLLILTLGCKNDNNTIKNKPKLEGPLFSSIPTTQSQVYFKNEIKETNDFNFIRYTNIYNGSGLAIGDINNDGLSDIYFVSNQSSNKLYLNKGNFEFEDITKKAGVSDDKGWSTGVSMIDINNDGYLDIYVCKSASINNNELRRNKLFINQKDNTFIESAKSYNLDDMAFSNQAYFFDYDKDGDNDMYLVNHRVDFENTIRIDTKTANKTSTLTTDKLYRNDGQTFTDVSQAAGVLNNTWGHSASIADFNEDGWLDIYVCNDFIHGDNLFINDTKGGFTNKVHEIMDHTSFFSMGSDIADINNDSKPDLVVLDMVSEEHTTNKKNMAAMSTEQFHQLVALGHHYQYMSNILQLNRGNGVFSEVALSFGIAFTDWSWAPLLADFDNNGHKDLFITNGIKRDMTDNDYKIELDKRAAEGKMTLDDLFNLIPSRKIKNYIFENEGNNHFTKRTDDWGFTQFLNSNGASYADLDNDGDLDLVTNNMDDYASIYKNNSSNNFLKLNFIGPSQNILGLGTKVTLLTDNGDQYYEHYLNRGYLSSVDKNIIIGLGEAQSSGPLYIEWPDGKTQIIETVKANTQIEINYNNASNTKINRSVKKTLVSKNNKNIIDHQHIENDFNDFAHEVLLPNKYSTLGPAIAKADTNNDGLEDILITGAVGKRNKLYLQKPNGTFEYKPQPAFEKFITSETVGVEFFDADADGDMDLYLVNGGNEKPANSAHYKDGLFINDGKGNYSLSFKNPSVLTSGKAIASADYDNDGDLDLFIGGRIVPGKYPLPANSVFLQNNKGQLKDITAEIAPELKEIGLITDAIFSDYDGDNDLDILLVGEWMGLTILENNDSKFSKKSIDDVTGIGWWYSINTGDFDNDGDQDYILGNLGANNKFDANQDKPFHVFCNDFDDSGNLDIVLSKEKQGKFLPVRGRECSSQQMPFIKEKFPTYKSFAEADLKKIYGEDKLASSIHYNANNFNSIILINSGDGNFTAKELPSEAQFGPTLCTEIIDINEDGNLDIIGAGNIYNSEVETIRYDASKGYILLGDGTGKFEYYNGGFIVDGNVKDLLIVKVGTQSKLFIAKNNGPLEVFDIK